MSGYQFSKIKLVIWDLDETLWNGTLSEGDVLLPDLNRQLLIRLTDIGIMNSICSKNDWNDTKKKLEELDILQYFVFPSVNWQAKGSRISDLISDMQLRAVNVLFLDDNPSNLGEAEYFNKGIMTAGPDIIPQLLEDSLKSEKLDLNHSRLKQYRVLEEKKLEKESYSSNEAFLLDSDIQLKIEHDCKNHVERIQDLIMRSNQLNFTKIRSSVQEVSELLDDPEIETGYVSVSDKFGDYGIVGFYALKENKLLHFVFSCRTLGMGIEQYTYNYLGRPDLTVTGEVISDLSMTELPAWINQNKTRKETKKLEVSDLRKHMVLVKGPCDLFQVYPYIANTEMFDTDFSHTTEKGVYIESTSHTTHLAEAVRLTEKQKKRVIDEVPFVDGDIYSTEMFDLPYKVIFISILTDANLGVYRRKETGERFAFVEYIQPVTDPKNWDGLISGRLFNNGFQFTREILEEFSSKYEFVGRNTPEQVVSNLKLVRENLREDCVLAIMLGGELEYKKNTSPAYADRYIVHRKMNDAVRDFAKDYSNIRLVDVNKYLVDQNSFYDHYNHYIKPVYYSLASDMVNIVNECTGENIKETSKIKMIQIRAKEVLAPAYHRLRKIIKK